MLTRCVVDPFVLFVESTPEYTFYKFPSRVSTKLETITWWKTYINTRYTHRREKTSKKNVIYPKRVFRAVLGE